MKKHVRVCGRGVVVIMREHETHEIEDKNDKLTNPFSDFKVCGGLKF